MPASLSRFGSLTAGSKLARRLPRERSWWASGLEMTLAGVIVGGATYAIGLAFA
jgi:hypothetical protein